MAGETKRTAGGRDNAAPLPLPGGPGGPAAHAARALKPEPAADPKAALRRLWGYLGQSKGPILLAAVLVLATSALNLVMPLLMARALDGAILKQDMPALAVLCFWLLLVSLTQAGGTWIQNAVMLGVAQRTILTLRSDLFSRLTRLPLRYFDTRSHGDLMSRLTNDVENVNSVLSEGVTGLVSGVLGLAGSVFFMLYLNVPLALVTIFTVGGLTLLVTRVISPRLRSGFKAQQATLGTLNGMIEENIGGQRVVQAYRAEARVQAQFDGANAAYRGAATRAQILGGFMGPFMNGINNIGLAVVVGTGGYLALRGYATVGTVAAFISYARQFVMPLNNLANLYNSVQGALAGAERVFEVMDEEPETGLSGTNTAQEKEPGQTAQPFEGRVCFDHVHFSYVPGVPVLRDISLCAEPGHIVALIGPTGAGKTTIINLLTRFYEIDSGSITIDGQDLREIAKEELRPQLGLVLQDTFLFAGTVRDNLKYAQPGATQEQLEHAARLANAHDFIMRLPHGYDTELTERASNLSQGQRQMLSIARTVLADPRILILDEATSSVDTRTERHIQEAMKRLMAGRTSFVIAHRLSTIREADQILFINQGQIVERGNHAELMALRGEYFRLSTGGSGDADSAANSDGGGELHPRPEAVSGSPTAAVQAPV